MLISSEQQNRISGCQSGAEPVTTATIVMNINDKWVMTYTSRVARHSVPPDATRDGPLHFRCFALASVVVVGDCLISALLCPPSAL